MLSPSLELVSHNLCPYVQRSVITLTEKDIEHTRCYIDLSKKPEWFLALSPTGTVPLLVVNNRDIIFESAVICEYLDEITPGTLHPVDSLLKAQHRAWNEYASQTLNNIGRLYNAKNKEAFDGQCQELIARFARINEQVKGPFFRGEKFCMVDAAFGPVFRYFDVMDNYLPIDLFSQFPTLMAWRENLRARPSVIHAAVPNYHDLLTQFLIKRNSYISTLIAKKDTLAVN